MSHHFYTHKNFHIPMYMAHGIRNYIENHIPPGDFLTAIIENNLKKAVYRADDENLQNIQAYVSYFYNNAPMNCWGSPEKVKKWISQIKE